MRTISTCLLMILSLALYGQKRDLSWYIEEGMRKSPVLQDFRNQVQLKAADSLLIVAGQKPLVEGNSLLSYAPVLNGIGYDQAITNGSNIGAAIAVSQPIFNKKIRQGAFEKVRIESHMAGNSYKLALLQLKHDIGAQYLVANADLDMLHFNSGQLQLYREEQSILQELVDKGLQPQSAYIGFLLEKQGMERQVRESTIQYRRDLADLNILCGINDTAEVSLEPAMFKLDDGCRGSENPFLQQYLLDSVQLVNAKYLVDNQYRPSLKWMADAGLLSSQFSTIGKNFGFSAGLSFSVPIYDGHQRSIQYSKLAIEEQTREKYFDYFYVQRSQEIGRIRRELAETQQSIDMYTAQKTRTEQLMDNAKKLLNLGTMSITDYILIVRNYRELILALSQAGNKRSQLINDFNYLHW